MKLLKNVLLFSFLILNISYAYNNPSPVTNTTTVANGSTVSAMPMDDGAIASAVNMQLSNDKQLKQFNIQVNSNNGIVALQGQVKTDRQFDQAVELAESTPGVKDVNTDNLTVKGSDQPVSDSIITSKVKGLIMQNKLFSSNDVKYWTVHVTTNNGVVYLTGTVDNQDQKANVVNIAKSVNGVISVDDSGLSIQQQ